jgi:hypothetical protein
MELDILGLDKRFAGFFAVLWKEGQGQGTGRCALGLYSAFGRVGAAARQGLRDPRLKRVMKKSDCSLGEKTRG